MPVEKPPFQHSHPVRLVIPADLKEVAGARQLVTQIGEAAGLSESRVFDLQVATSEAVANAIEHASTQAELLVWRLPDRLIVEVTNDGAFRPGLSNDDTRRRGLGLPLMVSLADDVHVVRDPEGRTRLSLTFLLQPSERSGVIGEAAPDGPEASPATILARLNAERLKAQAEGSRAALLADVLDHSCQPFGIGLPDGGLFLFNQAYADLLGYTKEEFTRLDWIEDLTPADWREHERFQLERLARSGESVRYEKEYFHKDGSRVPVDLLVHVVSNPEGGVVYYYAFVTDLTARKYAERQQADQLAREMEMVEELGALNEKLQTSLEDSQSQAEELTAQEEELRQQAEELRSSEQRYRIVSDFTYGWELWRSPGGELLYVSPGCERITGFPREAFLRDPNLYVDLVHPDDQELVRDHFEGSGSCDTLQFRMRTRGGAYKWIEHVCQQVVDGSGRDLGRRSSDRDITWRKQAESDLLETKAALEDAVAETAHALESARQELGVRTQHLDAFFEHSLTPFVLLDKNLNFVRVNEAFARGANREADDFPGHNYFDLYPSEARVIFDEVLRTRQPFKVKARPFADVERPEQELAYWDWTLTPLLDGAGEVEMLVFALEDVTGRVRPLRKGSVQRLASYAGRWLITRRRRLMVVPIGVLLQFLLFYGLDFLSSPSQYLGIPGPTASLIGVMTAITAGPAAGAIVALAGGMAFTAYLGHFGEDVIWPTIIASIVLWMAVSVVAGLAGEVVRRRAESRETLLRQSVNDRDVLLETAKASEEMFRRAAEENSRLYEEQQKIAERLQHAFLHIPTQLGPLRLGHLYRAATVAERVGGDFYDVFDVGEEKIAVLIGDVAGHGIEAARAAALTKDVIHAFIHQSKRVNEVLASTNALLLEKLPSGFVTLFLAILDFKHDELEYASAGHPQMFLKHSSGAIAALGGGSPPLGIFPDARWRAVHTQIRRGDLLLLYTDGVIEARRDGDFFGERRLRYLLSRERVAPENLPQLILDEILEFSGGGLHDDAAVLTVAID
ncbi:MAG: SpoIIE family protein phosphatase [Actinobacteria bacterium]|nr:SpoIIE family protein phosphatase [Actinomycetota bacterium]